MSPVAAASSLARAVAAAAKVPDHRVAAEGRRQAEVAALCRQVAAEVAEDRRPAGGAAAADHPAGRQAGEAAAVEDALRPCRRRAGVAVAAAHRLHPAAAAVGPEVLRSAAVAEPPGCVSDTPPCRNVPTVLNIYAGGEITIGKLIEAGERNQLGLTMIHTSTFEHLWRALAGNFKLCTDIHENQYTVNWPLVIHMKRPQKIL